MTCRFIWKWVAVIHFCVNGCVAFSYLNLSGRSSSSSLESLSSADSCAELINLGIESKTSGNLEEAASFFEKAVQKDDKSSVAHFHLGMTLRKQNNLMAAATHFRRATELQSDDKDAKYQLGVVLTDMGYVDAATRTFRDIIAQEDQPPNSRPSQAKISLANVLVDGKGERLEALVIYRQCCAHGPSPMALLAGIVSDSMENHDDAEKFYMSGLTTDDFEKADPETALHLMMNRMRDGDKASVIKLQGRLPRHISSSAEYVLATSVGLASSTHYFTYDMFQLALEHSHNIHEGLILEFGVYHGKTIRMIASYFPNKDIHGFDTFSGIPEAWHYTPSGSYSTQGHLPDVPDNVHFHVGLFSETLPGFLKSHPGPIRFMNIDCDLYSSTKDVLDAVHDRIVSGTIIIFDEYVMNPNWEKDEHKAFKEAVEKYGWEYEYLAISIVSQQAIVRIL